MHKGTIFYWLSFLYGWPEASVIPIKTFSTFKAAAADMSRQNSGRDLCLYRGRKVAKGGGEQRGGRLNGKKHVQHPWRATGERMVPRERRWFCWVCARNTDTRPQQPSPIRRSPLSFLYAGTPCTAEKQVQTQHWALQTKHSITTFNTSSVGDLE